eukprot:2390219-Rhodomonas_salina.1
MPATSSSPSHTRSTTSPPLMTRATHQCGWHAGVLEARRERAAQAPHPHSSQTRRVPQCEPSTASLLPLRRGRCAAHDAGPRHGQPQPGHSPAPRPPSRRVVAESARGRGQGFPLIVGGHDHEPYLEQVNGAWSAAPSPSSPPFGPSWYA